jgi:osomolarity two-component system, sensor histidine kinase NIK1
VNLLETTVCSFGSQARAKRLELVLNPDSAAPSSVRGDSMRLRQILTNLIGNALKFTGRGAVLVTTRLVQQTKAKK